MANKLKFVMQPAILASILTIATLGAENFDGNSHEPRFLHPQTETQDSSSLKMIIEEDYSSNYKDYHLKALDAFKCNCYGQDEKGTLYIKADYKIAGFQDTVGWAAAISNFEQVMNTFQIPPVKQWNVRGFAKKYNERLLKEILENIDKQKKEKVKELSSC